MTTDVEICTTALLMIGADEINSFVDETREAKLCASLYPVFRDDMLQSHPWRFAIGQFELNKLVNVPLFGFANAFQLPANYLRLIGKDQPQFRHKIFEDKLYADANGVKISYQFAPNETTFPSYFVKLLEYELAKVLSVSLLEDEGKATLYERLYKDQLLKARNLDSQSDGEHGMPEHNFKLTAIRL